MGFSVGMPGRSRKWPAFLFAYLKTLIIFALRRRAAVARWAHNPEVAGSSPAVRNNVAKAI